jgi:hypothetical protein
MMVTPLEDLIEAAERIRDDALSRGTPSSTFLNVQEYRDYLRTQLTLTRRQQQAFSRVQTDIAERMLPVGIRPLLRRVTRGGVTLFREMRFTIMGRRGLFGYKRLRNEGLIE